jgi:hypothetical protein
MTQYAKTPDPVSDTDAEDLWTIVRQFAIDAEAWIKARYPL